MNSLIAEIKQNSVLSFLPKGTPTKEFTIERTIYCDLNQNATHFFHMADMLIQELTFYDHMVNTLTHMDLMRAMTKRPFRRAVLISEFSDAILDPVLSPDIDLMTTANQVTAQGLVATYKQQPIYCPILRRSKYPCAAADRGAVYTEGLMVKRDKIKHHIGQSLEYRLSIVYNPLAHFCVRYS